MLTTLAADIGEVMPMMGMGGGLVIAFVAVVGSFIRSSVVGRARERSRREIAAYVAEGSMSADEGAKLLEAGRPHWEKPNR